MDDGRITLRAAARILGVHEHTVAKFVERGELPAVRRGRGFGASIDRDDVDALMERRAAAERAAVHQQLQNHIDAEERRRRIRPDDQHVWLSMGQAARLLGVTRQAIRQRCDRGTIPFEWSSAQRWVRQDLLELVERAHRAQARRQV